MQVHWALQPGMGACTPVGCCTPCLQIRWYLSHGAIPSCTTPTMPARRTSDLLLTKVEAASCAARRSCSRRSRAAWNGLADGAATQHAVAQLIARDRQHMQKSRNNELPPQPPTLSSHSALMLYRRSPMGAPAQNCYTSKVRWH